MERPKSRTHEGMIAQLTKSGMLKIKITSKVLVSIPTLYDFIAANGHSNFNDR
jgi:hypothetical protein